MLTSRKLSVSAALALRTTGLSYSQAWLSRYSLRRLRPQYPSAISCSYLRSFTSTPGSSKTETNTKAEVHESKVESEDGTHTDAKPKPVRRTLDGAPRKKQRRNRGPVNWWSFGFLLFAGCGAVAYYRYERERVEAKAKVVKSYGKPAVGGPFTLTDAATGKTVTDKDFRGKYMLIYFGFTYCPDICPAELQKMEDALRILERKREFDDKIKPIFVTVDPARDTPERMKEYSKEYHPKTAYLTGNEEQLTKVCKAFRVYFSMPDLEDGVTDYLVDHSIFFYLMDREGDIMEIYGKNFTATEVANSMMTLIRADQSN